MSDATPDFDPQLASLLEHQPLNVLSIGTKGSALISIARGAITARTPLTIGYSNLCPGPFRTEPPTPVEMEQAIQVVEDAVMPLAASIGRERPVAVVIEPVDASSLEPGVWSLTDIAVIESAFQHLSALSEGRPARADDPLWRKAAAAKLLIVREACHHWGLPAMLLPAGLVDQNGMSSSMSSKPDDDLAGA